MSSSQNLTKRLEEIKNRTPNKTCFDCGEKGTTYAAMDFGTFVCSRCAGLLREINFKVKGTGVSIFKEKEIDFLDKMGNENAKKIWMGKFKENSDKKPNPKDLEELKRFLITKYKDKRFYKKPKKNSDDDEEEDNKKNEEKKKKNNKKKDSDSSSEESESDDEEEESDEDEDDDSDSDDYKKNNKNKENEKEKKEDFDKNKLSKINIKKPTVQKKEEKVEKKHEKKNKNKKNKKKMKKNLKIKMKIMI